MLLKKTKFTLGSQFSIFKVTHYRTLVHENLVKMAAVIPTHNSQDLEAIQMPRRDEWIKKTVVYAKWNIIQTEDEILSSVVTWKELENVKLSKVNQREKDKYQSLSHMWRIKKRSHGQ